MEDGEIRDGGGAVGRVEWVLTGPDGEIKERGTAYNLITQVGDQRLGEAGAGIGGPPAPNGMKLGTGTTAPSKTGTGALLTTYLADSHVAFDAAPTSGLNGAVRRITYKATWGAGKATTAASITECVIVNDYVATSDVTSPDTATLARVLLSPAIGSKGTNDTLTVTWTWDVGTA